MNFKKIMISLVFALTILSVGAYAKTMEFTMGSTDVNIRDNKVTTSAVIETAPYTVNDRTMVPVRIIMENFGADVAWNEAEQKVTITQGDRVITLVLGSNVADVNGTQTELDVTPVETNGRTMVPLRFVSENLGYDVSYVEITEQVLITDSPAVAEVNGKKISYDFYELFYNLFASMGQGMYPEEEIAQYALDACYQSQSIYDGAVEAGFAYTADEYAAIKAELEGYYPEIADLCLNSVFADYTVKSYLASDFQNYLAQIALSQDFDAEKYYKENYMAAKHILISKDSENALKTAKDIKSKLSRKADFDKLMNEYSEDTGLASYPDGYVFTDGEMVAEFENTVKNLKVKQISDIVETTYGYHIIMRIDLFDFDENLKNQVMQTAAVKYVNDYIQGIISGANCKANYSLAELVEMCK